MSQPHVMKTLRTLVTTISLILLAGCVTTARQDNTQMLLSDPEVRAMAADHPNATKKVFRVITSLERQLEER